MRNPTKCVCATCNNGWMSNLEGTIKPILTPLFYGRFTQLCEKEQLFVSIWATKTAFMLQYAQSPQHPVHPEWRRLMFAERRPAPVARVWIAAYGGPVLAAQYDVKQVSLTRQSVPYPQQMSGDLVTFSIVRLVFQVWVPSEPMPVGMEYERLPGQETFIEQIWPVRPHVVDWPPTSLLRELDFKLLCRNFG